MEPNALGNSESSQSFANHFDERLRFYSEGKMSRKELEKETGLDFGDIILELRKRGLQIPRYDNRADFTEKQTTLYKAIFEKS